MLIKKNSLGSLDLRFNGELNKEELKEKIILRTCQYARRQLRWFRQENIDLTIDIGIAPHKLADHIVTGFKKQ